MFPWGTLGAPPWPSSARLAWRCWGAPRGRGPSGFRVPRRWDVLPHWPGPCPVGTALGCCRAPGARGTSHDEPLACMGRASRPPGVSSGCRGRGRARAVSCGLLLGWAGRGFPRRGGASGPLSASATVPFPPFRQLCHPSSALGSASAFLFFGGYTLHRVGARRGQCLSEVLPSTSWALGGSQCLYLSAALGSASAALEVTPSIV